jgi:hypothetical protein
MSKSDNESKSAPAAAPAAASEGKPAIVLVGTAPLASALVQAGLSEQQIVQDRWPELMSLPLDAVLGIMVQQLDVPSDAQKAALIQHATLDVLKVKPSSPQSCEIWCRVLERFTCCREDFFGTGNVRDALLTVQPQATTAGACEWWCNAFTAIVMVSQESQQRCGTAAARGALLALRRFATSPDRAQAGASRSPV